MKRVHSHLMASRWVLVAALGITGAAASVACAASEDPDSKPEGPDTQPLPDYDAAPSSDASPDAACADAAACAVVDCTTVDFCPTELPVSRLVALTAIWGSGPSDVWAVGSRGTVLHFDGSTFVPIVSDAIASGDVNVAVWGTSSSDVWILGPSFPLHTSGFHDGAAVFEPRRGTSWDPVQANSGRIWTGQSIAGRVWIAGESSRRFGGTSSFWSLGDDGSGGAVWTASPACAEGQPCTPAVRAIWAADASTLWAVGRDGQAFSFDATTAVDGGEPRWLAQNTNTRDDLEGVWGSSPSDVWAVGQHGTIRHGARGTATWWGVPSGTTRDLHAIWGSGPNDVWAVGDAGTILHFDGTAWTPATLGLPPGDEPPHLFGIWGSGPDDVWIAGQGILLHRTAASRRHS